MTVRYEEAAAQLTGPGGPFEIVVEPVRGLPMKNFKNRERSLRDKIALAALHGEREFIVQGDRRVTYRDFARRVWGAARTLRDGQGLRRGDRMAILAYNSPDWLMALFGASSIAAGVVGLNGWWTPEEIAFGLADSGSRFLVVDERLYSRAEKAIAQVPSVEKVFYIGSTPPRGTIPIEEILVADDEVPTDPVEEDDPFVLLYTSGTTGRPKACITTHRGTIAQVLGVTFASVVGMILGTGGGLSSEGDPPTTLVTSPLFHVAGLHSSVCTGLTAGLKLVFLEGRFEPETVMQLIEREQIAIWGGVPALIHRLVHHPRLGSYDLTSLRSISFGAAPMPPETIERARAVLPIEPSMTQAYGLTETHGIVTVNAGKDLLGRKASIGRPIPILDLKVTDEEGRERPDGEPGELRIFGPTVTPGYWNRPDATAETVVDGWLRTGDIGYRDRAGFFFLVDRLKDMILRGGENVYCVEIENALAEHAQIEEAAVLGMPDRELGERVKAIVRLVPGARLSAEAVQRHVASRLARFKVPEVVEFTDRPLPRNPAGKLLKNALRGRGIGPFDPSALDEAG